MINWSGGAVAQLVEQRTENPCVAGSIPAHTTKKAQQMLGFFMPGMFSLLIFNKGYPNTS